MFFRCELPNFREISSLVEERRTFKTCYVLLRFSFYRQRSPWQHRIKDEGNGRELIHKGHLLEITGHVTTHCDIFSTSKTLSQSFVIFFLKCRCYFHYHFYLLRYLGFVHFGGKWKPDDWQQVQGYCSWPCYTPFFCVFFFSSDDSLSVLFRFAATWWTTRSAWWNEELSMTWRSWRGCENRRLFSLACARLQCERFFYSFVALYVVVVVYFPPQSPEQEPPQPAVRAAVPEERRADPTVSPQIFLCFAWTSAGWLLPTSGWRTETYVHSHRRSLSSIFSWIWVSDFVRTSAAYHENCFLKQHNEGGSRHFAVIDISETDNLRNSTQKQKQL